MESVRKKGGNLTEGPIGRGLFTFMVPIFLGQLLQQLYNMADAWVVLLLGCEHDPRYDLCGGI